MPAWRCLVLSPFFEWVIYLWPCFLKKRVLIIFTVQCVAFINLKYNLSPCFFLIWFFWGEYVWMKLLFGLEFVYIPKVRRVLVTDQVPALLDARWMQHTKKNPPFQLICKLQKSGLLIKNSLHHHFCFFRGQRLLLQIFKIFSYCYVWLVQIDIFAVRQCYDFIRFYWQLALRQC